MRTLVTGCSGYVGTHLVPRLQAIGAHVVGLDRVTPPINGAPDEFIRGDLNDAARVKRALHGVDRVVHLAAAKADWGLTRQEYFRDNLDASLSLVSAGRTSISSWIIFSTVGVYGPSVAPLAEDGPLRPTTPYGESKLAAENVFRALAEETDAPRVSIIRPSAIFGPGNPPSTNVYRLIDAIVRHRFVMVGDGDIPKTTSYMDNVLAAVDFVLSDKGPDFGVYNYVDQPIWTTRQLVLRICELTGNPLPRIQIPLGLASRLASVADFAARAMNRDLPITSARIEKFATATVYDSSRIRNAGFEQPVSLDDAIAATLASHPAVRALKTMA